MERRSDKDIRRYYERVAPIDCFGVWGTELLTRLPYGQAIKFMRPDHGWTEETWARAMKKKDDEALIIEVEDLFQYAVEHSILHRGRATSMLVHQYLALMWLLADQELFAYLMDPRNYPNYGAPLWLALAQKYELMDMLPDDPQLRDRFMNMASGRPCSPLCPGMCGGGTPRVFRDPPAPKTPSLILPK